MDPATIAIGLTVLRGLISAVDAARRGEVLTTEQEQAVTDARKLATENAVDAIDEKLNEGT